MIRKQGLILFFLLLAGCIREDELTQGDLQIRVKNTSTYQIENVLINTSGGTNTYELVGPGTFSAYKPYNHAYRYAYLYFKIGSRDFVLQPMDYLGEALYDTGRFTYEITITDFESGQFTVEFKSDL